MGEEAVILCRDRAGEVHVFLNSCRHRGMKVCRYDEGNTPVFTCPYHGWSYGTDGKLVGVPYFREAYHSELDRAQWGLVEVAQLCSYKGIGVGHLGRQRPRPLTNISAISRRYLDLILDGWDGREGQAEVLGGVQKWLIPCNWKFPAENFSGDSYHNISHRSVDLVGIGPSGSGRRDCPSCRRRPQAARRDSRSRPSDDRLRAAQGSASRRPLIRIRPRSRNISAIARRSAGGGRASRPG